MAKKKGYLTREPIAQLEDLRDDCIAIVMNSGMTFKQVHERGGPTSQTTSKWLYRETKFPQLATIRAILNACDHDLTIAPKGARIQKFGYKGITMPTKKTVKAKTARKVPA